MLEEAFIEWQQKMRQEGRKEGYQRGFQEGFQKGFEEGFQKARREGRVEGLQKAVLEMLRQRFGPVPQVVRRSVREISSPAELTKLTRKILAAASLQETGLL